jgi:hypothetical protein
VFAIKRQTWQAVGRFDDGFYPAYFEESDYCFRARRRGIETVYIPAAHAIHLFTNREWEHEPLRHAANQHFVRYRFVCKHFESGELGEFFPAELDAIEGDQFFDQVVGRILAARQVLRGVDAIMARRAVDLDERPDPILRRQLEVGFAQLSRRAFAAARRFVSMPSLGIPSLPLADAETDEMSDFRRQPDLVAPPIWQNAVRQLFLLRQKEHELLTRIYFRQPRDHVAESLTSRVWRLFILRPLSYLTGRDDTLRREVELLRLTEMQYVESLNRMYGEHLADLRPWHREQVVAPGRSNRQATLPILDWSSAQQHDLDQVEGRARLLELLLEYDFR